MYTTRGHKSLVFGAWGITCVIVLGTTGTTRHLIESAAMRCPPLMAASVLRAFRQDDASSREKGRGHLHRCASTRSSNFGADRIVTVPARASRIKDKRDMIDDRRRVIDS
jgi:hypothetical protein